MDDVVIMDGKTYLKITVPFDEDTMKRLDLQKLQDNKDVYCLGIDKVEVHGYLFKKVLVYMKFLVPRDTFGEIKLLD